MIKFIKVSFINNFGEKNFNNSNLGINKLLLYHLKTKNNN